MVILDLLLLYLQLFIWCTRCSAKIHLGAYNSKVNGGEPSVPDFHDIHDSPFCADISAWGDVEWIGKSIEKCNTTFVKKRQDKRKTVMHFIPTLSTLYCNI